MKNYIYFRANEDYDRIVECYKIGHTTHISRADIDHVEFEMIRGTFIKVIELINCSGEHAFSILQKELDTYKIKLNVRADFYEKITLNLFEDVFRKYDIKYNIIN